MTQSTRPNKWKRATAGNARSRGAGLARPRGSRALKNNLWMARSWGRRTRAFHFSRALARAARARMPNVEGWSAQSRMPRDREGEQGMLKSSRAGVRSHGSPVGSSTLSLARAFSSLVRAFSILSSFSPVRDLLVIKKLKFFITWLSINRQIGKRSIN